MTSALLASARKLLEPWSGRCLQCGWTLAERTEDGCIAGHCRYVGRDREQRVTVPPVQLAALADALEAAEAEPVELARERRTLQYELSEARRSYVKAASERTAAEADRDGALSQLATMREALHRMRAHEYAVEERHGSCGESGTAERARIRGQMLDELSAALSAGGGGTLK